MGAHCRNPPLQEVDARETVHCRSLARGIPQSQEGENLRFLHAPSALPAPLLTRLTVPADKGDTLEGRSLPFAEQAVKASLG